DVNAARVATELDGDAAHRAVVRLFQRELDLVLDVAPFLAPRRAAAAPARVGAAAPEECLEEVRERVFVSEHSPHLVFRHRPVGLLQFLDGLALRDAERGVVFLEFHIQTPDLKTRSTACTPYKPTSSVMRSISCMSRRRASRPVVSLFIRGRRRRTASAIIKSRCTPARFTPSSSTRCLMTFRRSSSSREYTRMLPMVRVGRTSPRRSYFRSVCGCMSSSRAAMLIK